MFYKYFINIYIYIYDMKYMFCACNQYRFIYVETTSITIRPLNFHFRQNIKAEIKKLDQRCWYNVILLTFLRFSYSTKYQY